MQDAMKRLPLLTIMAVILLCPSFALADEWTRKDTYFQAVAITLMAVDWSQTSWAMKQYTEKELWAVGWQREYKYTEINPLLGDHPKQGRINTYFIGMIVGHTAIARLLPKPYRRWWQGIFIVSEAAFIGNNLSMGARIEF